MSSHLVVHTSHESTVSRKLKNFIQVLVGAQDAYGVHMYSSHVCHDQLVSGIFDVYSYSYPDIVDLI